jgi:hypothetical protein
LQYKVVCEIGMHNLNKALADIGSIRQQLAAGTMFRGLGPAVVAASGVLALATAGVQALWLQADEPLLFLAAWVVTAVVASVLIGAEMVARTRRHHAGLADAMLINALEAFLPAGAAGCAVALVLVRFAPEELWMLPGLWQILVSLGLFAAMRSLPRTVAVAAAFYFVAGVAVLLLSSQSRTLMPWAMGIPFAVGQLLLAAILHFAFGAPDDET